MNRRDFLKGGIPVGMMCTFPAFAFTDGVTSSESRIYFIDDKDVIIKDIKNMLIYYIFESNDAMTRREISVNINVYLSKLTTLRTYSVVCDAQNNSSDVVARNILKVAVHLLPKGTDKPIHLHFVVGITGVSITE